LHLRDLRSLRGVRSIYADGSTKPRRSEAGPI
jgi:hypothetical protein